MKLFVMKLNTKSKMIIINVLQVLAVLGMGVFFYCIINFAEAVSHERAEAKGMPPFPVHWEAAVMGHGSYSQWYSIEKHIFVFFFCIIGFAACLFFLVFSTLPMLNTGQKELAKGNDTDTAAGETGSSEQ